MPNVSRLVPKAKTHALDLFKAQSLRCIEMSDSDRELHAVKDSPSIHELVVILRRKRTPLLLLETLKSLKLTNLKLMYFVWEGADCTYKTFSHLNPTPGALAVSCPKVTSLQLSCMDYDQCGRRGDRENFGFWYLLPTFPVLRELSVERVVPDEVIPMLQKLESVAIRDALNATELASKVATPVTVLNTIASLGPSEVALITKCPCLRELALYFDPGAEGPLIDVARSAPGLRSLRLEWRGARGLPLNRFPRKHMWDVSHHWQLAPGFILAVVEALPELTALDLYGVRVDLKEILEVLRHIGTRLGRFGISLEDQGETPLDRLESVMMTLVVHNPSLQSFRFDSESINIHDEYLRERLAEHAALETLREQVRRVRRLLQRLQVSAPMFAASSTDTFCAWYFPRPLKTSGSFAHAPNTHLFNPARSTPARRIE